MKQIRSGEAIIDAQLSIGYESSSDCKDAFSRMIGVTPARINSEACLKSMMIHTPLGPMLAIADDELLYLLEFIDRRNLMRQIERLKKQLNAHIIPGYTSPLQRIEQEVSRYFNMQARSFETPILFFGTAFQKSVWEALKNIPYGETRSYSDLAVAIEKPSAVRAVAQANGRNQFAIIIPCHRVINIHGGLGGYAGGLARKKWLIEHEKRLREAKDT